MGGSVGVRRASSSARGSPLAALRIRHAGLGAVRHVDRGRDDDAAAIGRHVAAPRARPAPLMASIGERQLRTVITA